MSPVLQLQKKMKQKSLHELVLHSFRQEPKLDNYSSAEQNRERVGETT